MTGERADATEDGFTHRAEGTYSTLWFNKQTGLQIVAKAGPINALSANADEKDSFTVTARDNTGLESNARTLTVTDGGE